MKPFYWALLTSAVWGCVPILEKLGLTKTPALAGLFYRSLGVCFGVIVLLFFQFNNIRQAYIDSKVSLLYLLVGGFLASILGQVFFYQALKTGQTSTVVPIAASYPVISFILGIIFFGEPLTLAKAGGLAFVIMGVFLLR